MALTCFHGIQTTMLLKLIIYITWVEWDKIWDNMIKTIIYHVQQ